MKKKIVVNSEEFERMLKRLSLEIVEKNINVLDKIAFIGIRKRGVPIAERLVSYIAEFEGFTPEIGELDISLYRDDQTMISNEPVISGGKWNFSFKDRILIIVDDVLNSGRTVRAAIENILDHGKPSCIQLCVVVDTRSRIYPVSSDFTGSIIRISKDEFVGLSIKDIDNEDNVYVKKN
ncbi:MAG: bifunctional pyr operon transcriptional regulator/uracil phosphoribosyltransferase PyrR [Candidatus Muirbacterium halophilum]|nr:bifunctional pyr operon transcriptional regulator/uracil phosphoribosyltransferase PyrR [Candidatus Muirbacterium halophilum]MCK9477041.1 bifunctional pyr operon transcriptional regulator/uracil phosphoribosyltransferase PyrR [Candidatus Muirbacterium halophilum]